MLKVRDLSFAYDGGAAVLDNISISLQDGELVSLVGPSGCGKSTVLRLVAGLLTPIGGEITWKTGQAPETGFVFQDAALMPWADVSTNISLPLSLRGQALDAKRLEEILGFVGLKGLEKRYPQALSGGQQMRVSIARALAADAKLLLMDEPFGALDEILRFRMNDLMLALKAEQGWSGLFVTHSIYEAVYLSDRVLVMDAGRIAGEVTPGLDRTLAAADQRASKSFIEATRKVATILEAGSMVDA
ncbi:MULTISPECIES: ABC transporter ATP-binding protein [Kordiimonas]|jgi:NitT/TauT family transport system ATP-binding protein|uniref:ABC transporter ATP-binding protein n=1 Tax=Kordiimonas TaxID=288021 RepID=UPI00257B803E|nr:ATP-binding cassette domain-containing protein [Kordiimonas sp. UBA4487]